MQEAYQNILMEKSNLWEIIKHDTDKSINLYSFAKEKKPNYLNNVLVVFISWK